MSTGTGFLWDGEEDTWGELNGSYQDPPAKEEVQKQTIAFALKMRSKPTAFLQSHHPDFLAMAENTTTHPPAVQDNFDATGLTSVPGLRTKAKNELSVPDDVVPCLECMRHGKVTKAASCKVHKGSNLLPRSPDKLLTVSPNTGPSPLAVRSPRHAGRVDSKALAPKASSNLFGNKASNKEVGGAGAGAGAAAGAGDKTERANRRSSISSASRSVSRSSSRAGSRSSTVKTAESKKKSATAVSSSLNTVEVKSKKASSKKGAKAAVGSKRPSSSVKSSKGSKQSAKKVAKKGSNKAAAAAASEGSKKGAMAFAAAAAAAAATAAVAVSATAKESKKRPASKELETGTPKQEGEETSADTQGSKRRAHARDRRPQSRLFAPTAASKLKHMPKIEYTPLQKRDFNVSMRIWLREHGLEQYTDASHQLGLKNSRQVLQLTLELVHEWAQQAKMTKHDREVLLAAWYQEVEAEESRRRAIEDALRAGEELKEVKKQLSLGPLFASPLPAGGTSSNALPTDMAGWLRELGLGKYAQQFEEAGYRTPADVFALSQKELEAFILKAGFSSELHANRLREGWLRHCQVGQELREWLKSLGLGRYAGESVMCGYGDAASRISYMTRKDVERWSDAVHMAPSHKQRLLVEWGRQANSGKSIRDWMAGIGLQSYAPRTVVWGVCDVEAARELTEHEVDHWADVVEMNPGQAVCLKAEWRKLQSEFSKDQGPSDKSKRTAPAMKRWLNELGVGAFAQRSIDNGYDDLALVWRMTDSDIAKWAAAAGMGGDAEVLLRNGWKESQVVQADVATWLAARDLDQYINAAIAGNGYVRPTDLESEAAVRTWGRNADMNSGHIVRLLAEWRHRDEDQEKRAGRQAASGMQEWLRQHDLEVYAAASLAEGHDDPCLISQMQQSEVKRWADVVQMDRKASQRLHAAWQAEVKIRQDLEDWLASLGLGDCAYKLVRSRPLNMRVPEDLCGMQKQEVEAWASNSGLREGSRARLLAEWRAQQDARRRREGAAGIAAWLNAHGLHDYIQASHEQGFDQVESVGGLSQQEVETWASAVKMTAAATTLLLEGWRKENAAARRLDMERWMRAQELSAATAPTLDYGVDDPNLLVHLTEKEVTLWADEVGMQPGQKAALHLAVRAERRSNLQKIVGPAAAGVTMQQWLDALGLADYTSESHALGYDDPTLLKDVSGSECESWAASLGLGAEDTARLVTGVSSERALAYSTMRQWLRSEGLEQYATQSLQLGYDDVSLIGLLEEKEVEQWADRLGMNAAHTQRLNAATLQARADYERSHNDYVLASWLSAHGLRQYEPAVQAFLDKQGVRAVRGLSAAQVDALVTALQMPAAHTARFKRAWHALPNASKEHEGSLRPWLAALGLESYYRQAAKTLPGDDVSLLAALTPAQEASWAGKLQMLPGHQAKLAVAYRKLCEESVSPPTDARSDSKKDKGNREQFDNWLKAAGLLAFAGASRRYLGHASTERLAEELDDEAVESWANAVGMNEEEKAKLKEEVGKMRKLAEEKKAQEEERQNKIAAQQGMVEFMTQAGLQRYTQASIEQGFDDIRMVPLMQADDVAAWAETLGMTEEEAQGLEEAWKAVCARSQRVGEWLELHGLGQYTEAAEAAGFHDVGDLVAIDEASLRAWASGPGGLKAGHQARLVAEWRQARGRDLRGALMIEEEDAKDLQRVNEDLSEWLARAGLASAYAAALAAGYQDEDGCAIWTWNEEEMKSFVQALGLSEAESQKALRCWEGDVSYSQRDDPSALRWLMGALERNRRRPGPANRMLTRLVAAGENNAVKAELGVMKLVQLILELLAETEDKEVIKSCCFLLATLTYDNQVNSSMLVECDGIETVLEIMRVHEQSVAILEPAGCVLCNICFANERFRQDICEAGGPARLVSACTTHIDTPDLLPTLLTALANLALCRQHHNSQIEAGAARVAVALMRKHTQHVQVVGVSMRLLHNLTSERDQAVMKRMVAEGVPQAVLEVPRSFPEDMNMSLVVLKTVTNIARVPDNVSAILDGGAIAVAHVSLDIAPMPEPRLCVLAGKLIQAMTASLTDLKRMVEDELTVQVLCRALDSHPTTETVVLPPLAALANLAYGKDTAAAVAENASDPLGVICTVMNANKDSAVVLKACFHALCALCRCEDNAKALLTQLPLFYEAMDRHADDPEVVVAACRCLTNLAFHPSCNSAVANQGVERVLRVARKHPNNALVWLKACKALVSMAYSSDEVRKNMESQGVSTVMREVAARFASRDDVVRATESVIAAMSQTDTVEEPELNDVDAKLDLASQTEAFLYADESEEDSDEAEDLDCELRNMLVGGAVFLLVPDKGMPYPAHLYVDPSFKYLICKEMRQTGEARHKLRPDEFCKLVHLVAIESGHCTPALRRTPPRSLLQLSTPVRQPRGESTPVEFWVPEDVAFAVLGQERTFSFAARSRRERDRWVDALLALHYFFTQTRQTATESMEMHYFKHNGGLRSQ